MGCFATFLLKSWWEAAVFSPSAGGVFVRQSAIVHLLLLMRGKNSLECLFEGRAEYDGGKK